MSGGLTNRLADLAERAGRAFRASRAAEIAAVREALEAGRLLAELRGEARRGEWGAALRRAGIEERQAQRLMQLARSGLKPDTVSGLGGVKAALRFLARLAADGTKAAPEEIARMALEAAQLEAAERASPGFADAASARIAPRALEAARRGRRYDDWRALLWLARRAAERAEAGR